MAKYNRLVDQLMTDWSTDGLHAFIQNHPLKMSWKEQPSESPDICLDEGSWTSPIAEFLPHGPTQTARILLVRRSPSSTLPPTRGVFVHTAPTGDADYEARRVALAVPLLQHGIASAILMPAWYGTRSPDGQTGHWIRTVAEYQTQSLSVVLECVQLLRHHTVLLSASSLSCVILVGWDDHL